MIVVVFNFGCFAWERRQWHITFNGGEKVTEIPSGMQLLKGVKKSI